VRLASAIVWHTDLITDPDTLAVVDAALGEDAARLGPLSVTKTAQRIDALIAQHDPAAVRRSRAAARGRHVTLTPADHATGTAGLWGSLYATDAAILDRRLTQLAGQVCADDPRTVEQRRADALGALAAGAASLACGCANPDCPAHLDADPRAAAVTIHVVADATTLTAPPDPHTAGPPQRRPLTPDMTLAQALAPHPEPPAPRLPAAHLTGGVSLPAALVAELARAGARVSPLLLPAEVSPEPGYRPSAALARFIRCRDLTCRFPGCDRPADRTDIDHTLAYPAGPTHPSNLKCLCRKHHLLKTFWAGWRDKQFPDGTIEWTSPTGHT
ncbi:HNH endonuclease signature motif containing protein, partial [Mycobacterium sp. 050134]|uniref:HNH endonuclease signature motif containing protein n=1 Tax=Mycobacterium sp. 050134 TaxID=3096111 RepID=UPI002EDA68B2